MYGTKICSFIDVAAGAEASRDDSEGCTCAQDELPSRGALEEKWQEAENNITQAKDLHKGFHDRKTLASQTVVRVGEWLYLKNFTREDGLDPTFQGTYKVSDFRH